MIKYSIKYSRLKARDSKSPAQRAGSRYQTSLWKKAHYQGQLIIADNVHRISGVVPETGPFEVYRHKNSSTHPKLDILGRVTHKIEVRRVIDNTSIQRIKSRTEEAERERNSRQ